MGKLKLQFPLVINMSKPDRWVIYEKIEKLEADLKTNSGALKEKTVQAEKLSTQLDEMEKKIKSMSRRPRATGLVRLNAIPEPPRL